MDEEIEPDDLCPTKTPKVIEETFLRTMKHVWNWNTTGSTELMMLYCALLLLMILSMEVANVRRLGRQTFEKNILSFFYQIGMAKKVHFHTAISLFYLPRSLHLFCEFYVRFSKKCHCIILAEQK